MPAAQLPFRIRSLNHPLSDVRPPPRRLGGVTESQWGGGARGPEVKCYASDELLPKQAGNSNSNSLLRWATQVGRFSKLSTESVLSLTVSTLCACSDFQVQVYHTHFCDRKMFCRGCLALPRPLRPGRGHLLLSPSPSHATDRVCRTSRS